MTMICLATPVTVLDSFARLAGQGNRRKGKRVAERSHDWFQQARHDLEKAKLDQQWQYFEWACFTAHQAAEKAVKAVYYARHGEARGHGVRELLISLALPVDETLLKHATSLDRFYIPTRYPNGLPAGAPHDYFSREDAMQAIAAAEVILAWCQRYLSGA